MTHFQTDNVEEAMRQARRAADGEGISLPQGLVGLGWIGACLDLAGFEVNFMPMPP